MNSMIPTVLLANLLIITMSLDRIDGDSTRCTNQEHLPLCICRSSYHNSILTDLFLAKLSLSQCNDSLPDRQCRQSQFRPPSFHLTQLIPKLANLSHCFEDINCLHLLHSIEHCPRCQLTPTLLTHNNSYHNDTLPTDSCFYLCPHDTSCGFLCLNQHVIVSVNCNICHGNRRNITCRCIKIKQASSCLQTSYETTTERWMHKRGFPAAGFLALLILSVILLVVVIKLIYRQLDRNERRQNVSIDYSISPDRSRQQSRSYSNTLALPLVRLQKLYVEIYRDG